MRSADIVRLALSSLNQHKARTVLTVFGVLVGTFALVASLSIGGGVHGAVWREFRRNDQLRKIEVWPGYKSSEDAIPKQDLEVQGAMSDAKRERIRQTLIRRYNWKNVKPLVVRLTRDRVKTLAELEHVESVVPQIHHSCLATLEKKTQQAITSAATPDNQGFSSRMVAGEYLSAETGHNLVVSEYLLYLCGIYGDDEVRSALGKKLRLECRAGARSPSLLLTLLNVGNYDMKPEESRVLEKAIKQLPDGLAKMDLSSADREVLRRILQSPANPSPEARVEGEFTITGVFRQLTKEETTSRWGRDTWLQDVDIVLPVKMAEEYLCRLPQIAEHGFDRATVKVRSEEHVREVSGRIKDMGLEEFSLAEFAEQVRLNVLLISLAMAFVSAVALLVACLGITNTMIMSVLERTHEIGVMKAVGAKDSHIQLIFLIEGALIGLVGGGLGLLLSWIASLPGDNIARSLMEKQTRSAITESLFWWPLWLTLGAPLLASLVTTLAAVYPARRAAKVNPLVALRHE